LSASLDALIPDLQPYARELVRAAGAAGLLPKVTSTVRSYAEQKRLYDRAQQGLSPYPAAPPGHSSHEYGYSFDLIVSPMDYLVDVGRYWQSLGGIWGGQFKDPVHFEYPGFKQNFSALIAGAQALDDTPVAGGAFYTLVDLLSGFVPVLGEAQMVDTVLRWLGGDPTNAEFYLQHPAEAARDFLAFVSG